MSRYVGTPNEAYERAYAQARWQGYTLVPVHTTLTAPTQVPEAVDDPEGHQIAHCGQWWPLEGAPWHCPTCGKAVLG